MSRPYPHPPRSDPGSRLQMVTTLVRDSKAYPAQTESIVVRQVTDALRQCYTIVPRLATYVSDRGASRRLLALMGTIPIYFRGAQYNIPVTLWIMSYHPNGAPKVYVTPTSTMMVRSRHRHVDAAGLVYLPYLSEWDPVKSRIDELIGVMVSVFSQDPPVYARPAGSSATVSNVVNDERERLVKDVKDRIRKELEGVTAAGEREMMALLEEKEKLEANLRQGDGGGKERILEGIEKEILKLEKEKGRLEMWLKANKVEEGDLDVERIMVPQDQASEQVLDCVAKDKAIQDTMDALDEALEGELIDTETFVKEIRKLARDQFMARALLRKIKLIQAHHSRDQQERQADMARPAIAKASPPPPPPRYPPPPHRSVPVPMYR